jgi:hypothetical protein
MQGMTTDATAAELCQHLGVTRRTFARYCAGGLKAVSTRAKDGAKLYRMADVERYVRRLDKPGWRPRLASEPEPAQAPPAAAETAPAPPLAPRTSQELDKALAAAPPDELLDMQKRMAAAERATYGKWARTMQEFQQGQGDWTPGDVARLHRSWRESQEMVRRLAKELPEILYRKARYVDAEAVGATLGRAAAIVASELDQLGQAIAEKCEGQDARTIRGIIDDAVAGARLRLTEALQALCGKTEA